MKSLQDNKELIEMKLSLDTMKVNEEFQMKPEYRSKFHFKGNKGEEPKNTVIPFELPIKNLMKINEIESPMCKLEHIYKCCTVDIQRCLDKFWQDYDIPTKKLSVDVDNLQSIIVYMISHLGDFPQIIPNLYLIEDFLPEAVQLSNRAFYLAMMMSSCEFLLDKQRKFELDGMSPEKIDRSQENIEKIKQKQSGIRQSLMLDEKVVDQEEFKIRFSSIKPQDEQPPMKEDEIRSVPNSTPINERNRL
jgi:hypothetical protein